MNLHMQAALLAALMSFCGAAHTLALAEEPAEVADAVQETTTVGVAEKTTIETLEAPSEAVLATPPAAALTTPVIAEPPSQKVPVAAVAYWTIQASPAELREYSSRKFSAHTITLTNTQPYHIEILNAEVTNALDEQQLAHAKASSHRKKMGFARFATTALGAATYIPGVGGLATLGTGGLAAAHAVNAASNVTYQMSQLPNGNMGITGQYVRRVSDVVLGPNQTLTFEVVTEKDIAPDLRMVFKNLETSQILDVNQTIVAAK